MKTVIRNLFLLLVVGLLLAFMGETGCEAKKVRIVPDVKKGQTKTIYTVKRKKGKTTLKKLTAKTSNKSVASVKVAKAKGGKKYYVKVTGKKTGSVMVNVKVKRKLGSGKVKTSTLWFNTEVWTNEKQKAQEAFDLLNAVRKKAGQKELEWSEELWKVATTRVEKDGFDNHEKSYQRAEEYFCVNGISLKAFPCESENMYQGSMYPEAPIKAWENSPPHYRNMIKNDWQCGAIAYSEKNGTWATFFSEKPLSLIENWRTNTPLIRVRRIDNTTGEEIRGSVISIVDDVGNEMYRTDIKEEKSNDYYIFELDTFIVGKTYTVIEKSAPDGYKKAASVTFVAKGASEGPIEIVLSSDRK